MTFGGYIRNEGDLGKYKRRGVTRVEIRIHRGGHRANDTQPRFGMTIYEMRRPGLFKFRSRVFNDAFHPTPVGYHDIPKSERSERPKFDTGYFMSEALFYAFGAQERLAELDVEARVFVRKSVHVHKVLVTKDGLSDLVNALGPIPENLPKNHEGRTGDQRVTDWYFDLMAANGIM